MTRANKAVLVILVLILVIYLGVLGHTLIKTNRERREPAPPAPATIEAEVDDILEDVQAAVPSAPPGITPAEDAERFRELVQSLKRGTETVTQAERQTGRGQLPQAIEALENLLEHSPHRLDAKIMLADLYVQQNDFAKARDLYYDILAISPQIERGRLRLARTLQSLRHHQAAIHIALWILEDDDFQEEPNQIAALSYMALDQVERAVPHFRRQVAINRDNIVAQNNLAVAYSRLGDHRRAVALFRDVLTAEPGNAVTYYNLAVSLAKQDLEDEAVDVLNDAADRFGLTFVSSWLRSKDFDGIRESVAFVRLQRAVDADDDLF